MSGKFFRGMSIDVSGAQNTPSEILKLYPELDFTPRVMKSAFKGEYPDDFGPFTAEIPGEYRIVNGTTLGVIDGGHTVSKSYKPHPVREILESLCEVANGAQLLLNDAVVIRGGEHILLRATSQKGFEPVVGDIYGGSVLFKISNVPGIISSCSAFVLRLVCLNGATAREDLGGGIMKLHHRRNYDASAREEVEKLSSSLDLALRSYEEKMEILYNASLTKIPTSDYVVNANRYFRRLLELGDDVVESRVLDTLANDMFYEQPGFKEVMNTWAQPYNAVTYWVDHVRGRKPESSLFSMIYGDGARLKRKALQLALAMATDRGPQ